MSAEHAKPLRKHFDGFTVDSVTAMLVGVVFIIQIGAVMSLPYIRQWWSLPQTQAVDIKLSAGLVAVLVIESLALIGLWRVWKRLSTFVQKLLKYGVVSVLGVTVLYSYWTMGQMYIVYGFAGAFGVYYLTDTILSRYDLDWVLFDVLALALGVVVTAAIGTAVAPIVIIPVLVATLVWDHVAVNLSDLMGDLVEFSSSAGIPNYLIVPSRPRIDFDAVSEYVEDTDNVAKPAGVAGIIGIGDFAFPGALTASAWVAGVPALAVGALFGTLVAMVVLRDTMARVNRGLPALPWLNTGALVGFGLTVLVIGVPVQTAVGL